ncbi:MAG: hypothetical protein IJ309_02935, partial [Clostridia bacterium]|nr:hypothetical protein [Clostridia bacterium]
MKIDIHKSLKLFAFVMSVLVLIVSLPMYAFADLVDTSSTETSVNETAENKSEVFVVCEEEDLREENIKHFKLSDGTTKAVVYTQPVHYKDSEGKFVDIDNALTLSGNEHSAKNKLEIKFANKSGSSGLVSIKDGEYKIDFTPQNADKVSVEIENPQKTNSRKFDDLKVLTNLVSRATYKGIYDGIDLEYILVGNNIKENIIVNKAQKSYTYSFEIKLNKLVAELRDGAVILSDYDSGEQVYKIPAPYMLDANGAYSQAVEYTLTQQSKWKYTLTVTADPAWINAEDRAFPVTIDPTVVLGTNDETGTINNYVYSGGNDNFSTTALLVGNYMGYEDSRAFVKIFNELPALPAGTVLNSARLYMGVQNCQEGIEVAVYKVKADWTSGLTYANRDSYIENGAPVDCITFDSAHSQSWDITTMYKEWLAAPTTYHGVCFKGENLPSAEETSTWAFLAAVAHNDFLHPKYEITYTSIKGVEDRYAYFTSSAGVAGNGYVNAYNGALTFISGLATTADEILPYNVGLTYNSIDKSWTTGFDENITNHALENYPMYKWTDSDGTEHWFTPYMEKNYYGVDVCYEFLSTGEKIVVETPTYYYDEDGLGLILTRTNNGGYIISDDKGNKKTFTNQGKPESIKDTFGNERKFNYTNGKITSVSLIPNGLSEISQLTFSYDTSGNLSSVTNVQAKTRADITWSSGQVSEISYYSTYNTSTLLNTARYWYDNNYLTYAQDDKALSVMEYVYDTEGKVASVSENAISDGLKVGQKVELFYAPGIRTEILNRKNTTETTDDIVTVYAFDMSGKVQTVYTCDISHKTIYGSSSYEYYNKYTEAGVGPKKHNKIKTSAQRGGNSPNLLINPTFNVNSNGWTISGEVTTSNGSYAVASSGTPEMVNSLKLTHNNAQSSTVCQTVNLSEGAYTFSVYLNRYLTLISSFVKLKVLDSDNSVIEEGTYIPRSQETESSLSTYWEREELRFDIEAQGEYIVCVEYITFGETSATLYIDNAMLEKSAGASTHSIYENGDFISALNGSLIQGASLENTSSVNRDSALALTSSLTTSAYAKQVVKIPSGVSLDKWVISAWAEAESSMLSANEDNSKATLGIKVEYLKDGETELTSHMIPFNPRCRDWQYVSAPLTDEKDVYVDTVTISLVYEYNVGIARFDKVSLCQLGNGTSYEYNNLGYLSASTDGEGNRTEYAYTSDYAYDLAEISNKYGKTSVNYDTNHNVISAAVTYSNEDKLSVMYARNSQGQITGTMLTNNQNTNERMIVETSYVSNTALASFSRTETTIDERGNTVKYFYREDGLLIGECLNNDVGTIYDYDAYGQLIKVSLASYNAETGALEYRATANNDSISYEYNDKSELSSIITDSTEYSFTYDIYGNLSSVTIGSTEVGVRQLASYIYAQNNGNLESITYGNGTAVHYLYDNLDRIIGIRYNEDTENAVIYTYLPSGQIASAYDVENATTYNYYYDGSGKLTSERVKTNGTVVYNRIYKYNEDGMLLSVNLYCFESYASPKNSTEYTYDDDGRLQKITNGTGEVIEYEYDVFGRVTSKTSSHESCLPFERVYLYTSGRYGDGDTTGLVSAEVIRIDGNVRDYIMYEYDDRGNIVVAEYSGKYISYVYDDKNQLVRENNQALGKTYTYSYDESGNITSKKTYAYTTGTLGTATSTDVYSYTNEGWGDLLTAFNGVSFTYDEIGNPLVYNNGNTYNFTWQKGRQLSSATLLGNTYTYKYNQDGIRIEKTVGSKT